MSIEKHAKDQMDGSIDHLQAELRNLRSSRANPGVLDSVLVDVYGNGTRMTGFITDEHASGNYTVFVPTGPNPTNGFIFHVQADQIERLDQTKTDDALRSIIAVGVGSNAIMKF